MLAGRQVAVDTETSGFSPDRGHELLEIAVVVIDDGAGVGWK